MFKKLVATATFATVVGVAGQASAVVIDSASYTAAGCLAGVSTCTLLTLDATLNALPSDTSAEFDESTFQGQTGLGIKFTTQVPSNPGADLEIQGQDPNDPNGNNDGPGLEGVAIDFASAQIVTEIQLAHFYNSQHFSGDPNEIAIISANGGALSGTMQVFNDDDLGNPLSFILGGDLSGATVEFLSADKGLWRLVNPFGSNQITDLLFQAKNTPKNGDNSDYTIALIDTKDAGDEGGGPDTPEPTTLSLLGIGLIGLGLAAKRRRRRAANAT